MDPETVFQIAQTGAMTGWVALALSPLRPRPLLLHGGVVVPVALSLLYLVTVAVALPGAEGGFDTLAAVMALFAQPGAALAGWVHFLAFDLAIGGWQVREARRLGLPHLAVLPCLILTLMLGPVGLLAFLGLRAALSRKEALQ